MEIGLRVVQFCCNHTRPILLFTRITDRIALHLVLLPLFIKNYNKILERHWLSPARFEH